jgi:ribosomal protein L37AE/L43A
MNDISYNDDDRNCPDCNKLMHRLLFCGVKPQGWACVDCKVVIAVEEVT